MDRVRYEVFLGGRLLKIVTQIQVDGFLGSATADSGNPRDFVDGKHRWMVDQGYIAEDVAQAMLDRGTEWHPNRQ
jgi:hypothetical protein